MKLKMPPLPHVFGLCAMGVALAAATPMHTASALPTVEEFNAFPMALMRDDIGKPNVRMDDGTGSSATFEISEEAYWILQEMQSKGDRRSVCVSRIGRDSRVVFIKKGKCANPVNQEFEAVPLRPRR